MTEPRLTYEEPKHLTASIYAKGPEPRKLLFHFKRVATRSGSKLDVVREYSYPDGSIAAKEHVVYQANQLALFESNLLQTGETGKALITNNHTIHDLGSIEFEYMQNASSKAKFRREPLREDTLIGDMIGPFLTSHWGQLVNGEKVKCRYLVVPRRETVEFMFSKNAESTWQGRGVLILKMEPASRIIAALVEPLFFTIEKSSPHHVLEYVGRTTPKIQVNGKWKDLDAVSVFDWK